MTKIKKSFDFGGIKVTLELPEIEPTWTPTPTASPKRDSFGRFAPKTPRVVEPMREPDGFDAHIDRPLRENYRGDWFLAERAFKEDLAKYRKAESAVKECNWPTREPMGSGVPQWPTPQPMQKHSGQLVDGNAFFPTPTPKPSVVSSRAWTAPKPFLKKKSGLVPVGAVVIDHTWDGEPIFRI